MTKIKMLWLDLTVAVQEAELPRQIYQYCDVVSTRDHSQLDALIVQHGINLLCFDFDYPDRVSLRLLQERKRSNPSLPIIMMSLQHSESLAIWAFRTRVWDYLVKPISSNEVDRCFNAMSHIFNAQGDQTPRKAQLLAQTIPADAYAPLPIGEDRDYLPAINYVDQHFRSKISGETVARLCSMSPYRFSRGFKKQYGVGFREYVLHHRLREAKRMLENPNAIVSDVCYACGFNEPSYFSKMFRKYFSATPSEAIGSGAAFEIPVDEPQSGARPPHAAPPTSNYRNRRTKN